MVVQVADWVVLNVDEWLKLALRVARSYAW